MEQTDGLKRKIGILGGTFNPIHNGHLLLASEAGEALGIEKILLIPSGNSYMKDAREIAAPAHRIQMVKRAIQGNESFELSTCEIDRPGPSYTCDTLTALTAAHPENQYFFILGADTLFSLESWKNPGTIFEKAVIVAAVRGIGSMERIQSEAGRLKDKFAHADIRVIPARYIDLSSTEIRERIRNRLPVRYMVPDLVLQYMEEHRLYQE